MTQEINLENFSSIMSSNKFVLIDFWASWCGPCKMLLPTVEELAKEMADKILISKCNVDDNSELASQFNIMSIPALLIFKDGQLIAQKNGGMSKQALKDWIESNF